MKSLLLPVAAAVGAGFFLLASAAPAAAHAILLESSPADGAVLHHAPRDLTLQFNEPVSVPPRGVRLFDGEGDQVVIDRDASAPADRVVHTASGDLDDGPYILTWRVVSADGHLIRGAVQFFVGEQVAIADDVIAAVSDAGPADRWAPARVAARSVGFATTLGAVGVALFWVLVWRPIKAGPSGRGLEAGSSRGPTRQATEAPGAGGGDRHVVVDERSPQPGDDRAAVRRPGVGNVPPPDARGAGARRDAVRLLAREATREQSVGDPLRIVANDAAGDRLRRLAAVGALVAAGAAIALVAVQAGSLAGSGLVGMVDASTLAEVMASPFGLGMALRAVGLVALAGLLWVRPAAAPAPVVAAALLTAVSFMFVGHSAVTEPRGLAQLADVVHVGAAAVWFGGLVALALVLGRREVEEDASRAAAVVSRYSQFAAAALTAVALSGTGLAWLEVRALRALIDTTYGQVLLLKLAVVAVIVALAAYNRYRLLPVVRASSEASGARRLRRTVAVEATLMVAVLGVTAVLVGLQPARDALGVGGMFHAAIDVDGGVLDIVVDPNRAGVNEIHVTLLDEVGRPEAADDLVLRFAMPNEDIGPLEREPTAAGTGHWIHVGPELQIPGTWIIAAVITRSQFERHTVEVTVTVNP